MSLIADRLQSLVYDAKGELDQTQIDDIAAVLRATGRYEWPTEVARDVLAVIAVLSGPHGDNARYLTGRARPSHLPTNCGPLVLALSPGDTCPTCGAVVA